MTASAVTALTVVLALGLVVPNLAQAQKAGDEPFLGIWSLEPRTCQLSADEDEYRITIRGDKYREYRGECRIDEVRKQGEGTFAAFLSCGQGRRVEKRIVRLFVRDRTNAIFSEIFAKGRPSRNMTRCSPPPNTFDPDELAELEADPMLSTRNPDVLRTEWGKESKLCTANSRKAPEACTRRRYLAMRLRSLNYCHFTVRKTESWRRCD
jgi:hypothetical protein